MIAKFSFSKSGLTVQFTNKSDDNPDSFLWSFGDGQTSAEENPSHTYAAPGLFLVKLVVTKSTIDYEVSSWVGVIDNTESLVLDVPLSQLVNQYIPVNLPSLNNIDLETTLAITKWQLFLQPLVNHELNITNVYNEVYYTPLENYLIAQLVARDLILIAMNQYVLGVGLKSQGDSEENGQEVKAIKTGPSEAEWHSSADLWKEIFRSGGPFSVLTDSICDLSHRLRITLTFCRKLSHSPVPPQVYTKPKTIITSPFDKSRL